MRQQLLQRHRQLIFTPYKIRNQIINEDKLGRDIDNFHPKDQLRVLQSYMPVSEIKQRIIHQKELNAQRAKLYLRNFLNSHKSSRLNAGMNFHDLAMVARASAGGFNKTGLKAYYKFNETSGDIINSSMSGDSLGSGADLQVTGATYNQATGPFNYSMLFDGVNDDAVAGSSLSQFNFLHNTTALFSEIFWMRVRSHSQDEHIFGTTYGAETGHHLRFGNAGGSQLEFTIGNAGGVVINGLTVSIPDTTNWYFYSVTYDQSLANTNCKVKRNDANLATLNKSGTAPSSGNATNAGRFARNPNSAANYGDYYITECSIWNRVLTDAEITSLYNGGSGLPIT